MRPIILWEEFQCNCFSLTQLFLLVTSSTTYTLPRKRAGMAARAFRLQDLPDHSAATRFSAAVTLSHLTETLRFRPTKKSSFPGLKERDPSRKEALQGHCKGLHLLILNKGQTKPFGYSQKGGRGVSPEHILTQPAISLVKWADNLRVALSDCDGRDCPLSFTHCFAPSPAWFICSSNTLMLSDSYY